MSFRDNFPNRSIQKAVADDEVTYTPLNGQPKTVSGAFDKGYLGDETGSIVIPSSQPMFSAIKADFPSPARDDTILFDGVTYRVHEVQPDGYGWVTLMLEEV